MDKIINIILSILSGAVAGGITAQKIVHKTKQKTTGKNSPAIAGDANGNKFN